MQRRLSDCEIVHAPLDQALLLVHLKSICEGHLCNIQNPTSGKIVLNGKNIVGLGEKYRTLLGVETAHSHTCPSISEVISCGFPKWTICPDFIIIISSAMKNAVQVQPNLEDLYLFYFKGDKEK